MINPTIRSHETRRQVVSALVEFNDQTCLFTINRQEFQTWLDSTGKTSILIPDGDGVFSPMDTSKNYLEDIPDSIIHEDILEYIQTFYTSKLSNFIYNTKIQNLEYDAAD